MNLWCLLLTFAIYGIVLAVVLLVLYSAIRLSWSGSRWVASKLNQEARLYRLHKTGRQAHIDMRTASEDYLRSLRHSMRR